MTEAMCSISAIESGPVRQLVKIEIPADVHAKEFSKELKKVAGTAQIKGFRPGKVPLEIAGKIYGAKIFEEVLGKLASATLHKYVADNALPLVDLAYSKSEDAEEGKDAKLFYELFLFPQFELVDLNGAELTAKQTEFSDDLIDDYFQNLRKSYSTTAPVEEDKKIENGDFVTVEYERVVDDKVENNDGKPFNTSLEVGSKDLPSAVTESLLGVGVNEVIDIVIPPPKRDSDEASDQESNKEEGKEESTSEQPVILRTKIIKIEKIILPALNDDFAASTRLAENLADLQSLVKRYKSLQVEKENRKALYEVLLNKMLEMNLFEIPQVMIDHEIRNMFAEYTKEQSKRDEIASMNVAPFREAFGEMAEKRVRISLIIKKMVEDNAQKVDHSKFESWLDDSMLIYKMDNYFYPDYAMSEVDKQKMKDLFIREQVFDLLIEGVSVKTE